MSENTEPQAEQAAPADHAVQPELPPQSEAPQEISADGDVISRMFERDVVTTLDDKTIADIALKAADIDKERTELEAEKKKVVSDLNDRISKKVAEVGAILEKIRNGETTELRMVKEVRDYHAASVKIFIGPNFDQLVEERAMEGDELQKDLFLRGGDSEAKSLDKLEQDLKQEAAEFQGETPAAPTPEPAQSPEHDLRDVMREETSKSTKHTATDGPTG